MTEALPNKSNIACVLVVLAVHCEGDDSAAAKLVIAMDCTSSVAAVVEPALPFGCKRFINTLGTTCNLNLLVVALGLWFWADVVIGLLPCLWARNRKLCRESGCGAWQRRAGV